MTQPVAYLTGDPDQDVMIHALQRLSTDVLDQQQADGERVRALYGLHWNDDDARLNPELLVDFVHDLDPATLADALPDEEHELLVDEPYGDLDGGRIATALVTLDQDLVNVTCTDVCGRLYTVQLTREWTVSDVWGTTAPQGTAAVSQHAAALKRLALAFHHTQHLTVLAHDRQST